MKTYDYLTAIKEKFNLKQDQQLEDFLGITKASISHIKKGNGVRENTALIIADLLEIEPAEVLIQAAIDRTNNNRVKKELERVSKILSVAACLVISVISIGYTEIKSDFFMNNNIHYTKSRIIDYLFYPFLFVINLKRNNHGIRFL